MFNWTNLWHTRFYIEVMSLKGASWQSSLSNLRSLLRKVNHAPRENLLQIPGLGRSKVDKILEKRGSCGEGRMSVGDLVAVPGLGVGLLAKLSGGGDPLIPTLLKYIVYYQEVLQLSRVKVCLVDSSVDLRMSLEKMWIRERI